MYALIIKERARDMIGDAYAWYEAQRTGLGEGFLKELGVCFKKILKSPEQYGFIEKDFRRIQLARFPYIVIYEIISNEIVVYAVFHTKRNPDKRLTG